MAVQAVAAGTATPEQQKQALDWIVVQCAMSYDLSFHPDNPHVSAFVEGKRSVGMQIVKLLKTKVGKMEG